MKNMLIQEEAINTPILPALDNNKYYLANKDKIVHLANQATYEKLQNLTRPNMAVKVHFDSLSDIKPRIGTYALAYAKIKK